MELQTLLLDINAANGTAKNDVKALLVETLYDVDFSDDDHFSNNEMIAYKQTIEPLTASVMFFQLESHPQYDEGFHFVKIPYKKKELVHTNILTHFYCLNSVFRHIHVVLPYPIEQLIYDYLFDPHDTFFALCRFRLYRNGRLIPTPAPYLPLHIVHHLYTSVVAQVHYSNRETWGNIDGLSLGQENAIYILAKGLLRCKITAIPKLFRIRDLLRISFGFHFETIQNEYEVNRNNTICIPVINPLYIEKKMTLGKMTNKLNRQIAHWGHYFS
jgi:hypothetical protein